MVVDSLACNNTTCFHFMPRAILSVTEDLVKDPSTLYKCRPPHNVFADQGQVSFVPVQSSIGLKIFQHHPTGPSPITTLHVNSLPTMRPFKRPPPLLPHCTHCPHRPLSTTATATAKRRKARAYQKQIDRTLQERASTLRTRIHESRIARREDWILGPLAPSRDLGNGEFGTLSNRELKGVTRGLDRGVLTHRGRGGVTAAGQTGREGVGVSWKESLIWKGDRVVVVSGAGPESRDRGRIGEVVEVRRGTRQVVVEGLNEVRGSLFFLGVWFGISRGLWVFSLGVRFGISRGLWVLVSG